jgi:hypothetical protein
MMTFDIQRHTVNVALWIEKSSDRVLCTLPAKNIGRLVAFTCQKYWFLVNNTCQNI